jgi:DNA-binding response OmpR family regulator
MGRNEDILPKTSNAPLKDFPTAAERGNVLIVEDDKDLAEFLTFVLEQERYGVRAVVNRDTAVLALSKNLYQIVLLDLMMPGMGAPDFVSFVQHHCPFSTIILMTAGDIARQKALSLGIGYCLQKPFETDQLLEVLEVISN